APTTSTLATWGRADMDLTKLADPFGPEDIEWRVQQAGKGNRGIWAKVIAYVESRAIMTRLDQVCGPACWQIRFKDLGTSLSCGIGIEVESGKWIWKWDGAGALAASDGL